LLLLFGVENDYRAHIFECLFAFGFAGKKSATAAGAD
jgi:hypothetical protein